MLGGLTAPMLELLEKLSVSTELLMTVTLTIVLSLAILTGKAARIGTWVEDSMCRRDRSDGWDPGDAHVGLAGPSRPGRVRRA
jgi:hypothetical protein